VTESKAERKRITFGPFEVDVWSQELIRQGIRLRIAGQPFQILRMLLERPGELVSREELRKALWPSDTFVDFEHGLSAAVNKLRETLGDDANAPRYIETLPKRGYRFVGMISPPVQDLVPTAPVEEQREEPPGRTSRRRLWGTGLGSVALCSLMVASFFWLRSPFPPPRVLSYQQLTTDRRAKGQPCTGASSSRVVTDGARVFFSENGQGLMQVSANGGEVAPVSNPFACFETFDISPDKTELLGASVTDPTSADHPLCLVPRERACP
jgi:DNA-binding winged helix-turn-helix (wHTH) protein